jgi:hypothetical protein
VRVVPFPALLPVVLDRADLARCHPVPVAAHLVPVAHVQGLAHLELAVPQELVVHLQPVDAQQVVPVEAPQAAHVDHSARRPRVVVAM